ncbi:hypothetical protein ADIAL_1892 [Alkalibacterium sp. AK22]|nr:hypothetical protein ADIAL_1892 [Alkalibacterium sp. AK22]
MAFYIQTRFVSGQIMISLLLIYVVLSLAGITIQLFKQ